MTILNKELFLIDHYHKIRALLFQERVAGYAKAPDSFPQELSALYFCQHASTPHKVLCVVLDQQTECAKTLHGRVTRVEACVLHNREGKITCSHKEYVIKWFSRDEEGFHEYRALCGLYESIFLHNRANHPRKCEGIEGLVKGRIHHQGEMGLVKKSFALDFRKFIDTYDFSWDHLRQIFCSLFQGLDTLEQVGSTLIDIKPQNIVLNPSLEKTSLIDFAWTRTWREMAEKTHCPWAPLGYLNARYVSVTDIAHLLFLHYNDPYEDPWIWKRAYSASRLYSLAMVFAYTILPIASPVASTQSIFFSCLAHQKIDIEVCFGSQENVMKLFDPHTNYEERQALCKHFMQSKELLGDKPWVYRLYCVLAKYLTEQQKFLDPFAFYDSNQELFINQCLKGGVSHTFAHLLWDSLNPVRAHRPNTSHVVAQMLLEKEWSNALVDVSKKFKKL